jgi:carbon storage regulator CsrA
MLVLSRKLQQQIKIGDQITVTILRVKGNTVRVGISAPRDLRVIRGELPKAGEVATSETLVEGDAIIAVTGEDSTEIADSAEESTEAKHGENATGASQTPPSASAAHLPLRRIRNRYGRGPLKHIIAANCQALAK